MSIWQILAFVVTCNLILLAGVAIGAYAVYRTKREDGRFFNQRKGDEGKAFILDDDINEPVDIAEMLPSLAKRNARFNEQVAGKIDA